MKTPEEIVSTMLENDAFSQWLDVSVVSIGLGTCTLRVSIHGQMLNGFNILHGGISYSLADSALAFASNSYGYKCVSIDTSISHLRPAVVGDTLIATAIERHRGKTVGIYEVTVTNQDGKNIALFKGTVHISKDVW
jgi:acyl-CoA thioesterase